MFIFLASVVEQLDLALEHATKGDVHNARFGLMLTDNALELVLHQIVKDKRAESTSWRFQDQPYPHEAQLRKAFLGSFSDKIAFARLDGGLSSEFSRTFNIMHEYRNDVYHAGLAHEEILSALARFYFDAACAFIARYEPRGLSWWSGLTIPERAKKYFGGSKLIPGTEEEFVAACQTMKATSGHDADMLVGVLADDLDRIIDDMDTCVRIVASGVYEGQETTRDQAVVNTQAWDLAFDDAGRSFAAEHGFEGSLFEAVEFLAENFPFKYRGDPVPGWQAQAKKLRAKANPHMALDHYQSFIKQTGPLRASLEQSAAAAEAEIEAAIDRMRGK